jgi:uncharacterized pyridoxamine 5'-phosphate oxidase family protein
MELYEYEKERFKQYLKKNTLWVVATSSNDIVSARSMSIINKDMIMYFQTDIYFEKYKQLKSNPNIALCSRNFQVKGIAKDLGQTLDPVNKHLMELYKEVHPGSYNHYSQKPESCLIQIDVTSIKIWDYIENEPYITTVDLINNTANKIHYQ